MQADKLLIMTLSIGLSLNAPISCTTAFATQRSRVVEQHILAEDVHNPQEENTESNSSSVKNPIHESSKTQPSNKQPKHEETDPKTAPKEPMKPRSSRKQSPKVNKQPTSPNPKNKVKKESSREVSSESSKQTETPHFSVNDLLKEENHWYTKQRQALDDDNDQRIEINNQKGVQKLINAYQSALQDIASGKTTREQREQTLAKQRKALQQALATRLASLQHTYDRQLITVKHKLNDLPASHNSDEQAIYLGGQVTHLDYQLGVDSDKAYSQYNRSIERLEKNAAGTKVQTKSQQRTTARQLFEQNLRESDAVDPAKLEKENQQRVDDLKQLHADSTAQIRHKKITTPDILTSYIESRKSSDW